MSTLQALFMTRVIRMPRMFHNMWERFHARTTADEGWHVGDFTTLQPCLDDILTTEPPPLMRITFLVIAALFVALILMSCLVSVDMVVTASGRLITDTPTLVVQPMQLSIIREITVKVGDTVKAGDVLAQLDGTFTRADKQTLMDQQDNLEAQLARIEAELAGHALRFDQLTPARTLQANLFTQRSAQYTTKLRTLEEDLQRLETAIQGAERVKRSLADQLAIAREVEEMRAHLYKLQVGSKLNSLDSQALRMRSDREYEEATSKLDDLTHNLLAKRAERDLFVGEWRNQLLQELLKTRTDLSTVSENLVKANRLDALVVLRAPADGIVLDIAKRSVGSVVQAAEPVITLVPAHAKLLAELMVASADVGYATEGDHVALKMDAFPFQRHDMLSGTLRSIGQDSVSSMGASNAVPSAGQPIFHKALVALDEDVMLKNMQVGAKVTPGMTLSGEIKVGARTVMSYFLYPLKRGLSESMREP